MAEGASGRPLLAVRGLNAWYGESHILHGVEFDVAPGEVVTLLGRNGAGKTTTMKSIMGIVGRREGSVLLDGTETIGLPSNRIAYLGIALCPEERGIFSSLNVEENLLLPPQVTGGRAHASSRSSSCFRISRSASPAREPSSPAASSKCWRSGAYCAPAPVCCCSTSRPKGSLPVIVQQIGRTITELKTQGFTILLVEQNFHFAATVADRHYVMENGRVIDMIPNTAARRQSGQAARISRSLT